MTTFAWGIDLGGTKIEGTVLRIDSLEEQRYEILARLRRPTPQAAGYQAILKEISCLVEELETVTGLSAKRVGVGTPGVLEPSTGLLKNSNTQCLNGMPFEQDLEAELRLPVVTANDANCFAFAEAVLGAARGAKCVFGVILGTGTGGGLVLDGRPRVGLQGIAGEWGHNVLDPGGPPCYCGKSGCIETILAGPALERFYQGRTGSTRSLREIASRAASGEDPAAQETLERLVRYFGQALAQVINIVDPDCIVLGGGVSNIARLYDEGRKAVANCVFNHHLATPIVRHELGDSAGVLGAAMLTVQTPA